MAGASSGLVGQSTLHLKLSIVFDLDETAQSENERYFTDFNLKIVVISLKDIFSLLLSRFDSLLCFHKSFYYSSDSLQKILLKNEKKIIKFVVYIL